MIERRVQEPGSELGIVETALTEQSGNDWRDLDGVSKSRGTGVVAGQLIPSGTDYRHSRRLFDGFITA
jgi:hypothetical protein